MDDKMNVLFIITDQQRADHLSCTGNTMLKTPNIDSIRNEGVMFTNAFVANPMCMPNRATLITGLYPNMHGVRSNGINLPYNIPTITQTLKKKDYHTISVGKTHFQFYLFPFRHRTKSAENIYSWLDFKEISKMRKIFEAPYYGFDEVELTSSHGDLCPGHFFDWVAEKVSQQDGENFLGLSSKLKEDVLKELIKRKKERGIFNLMYDTIFPEELYPTTYVTERTIAFLERYTKGEYGDKPFFMHCSYPDPHHPVCPPGKYKNMYKPENIEFPASFHDIKNLYNHEFLGPFLRNPVFRGALVRESTEEEVRNFIALTYGAITMIDHGVGEILAALEKFGLADNTMVIYTSDHGDLMGDHGILLKGPCPFNGILQVPLLWKVPGLTKSAISKSLVSSIDIPKTILNLLDIKQKHQPPDMQGYDISPILEDPDKKIRDCCLIEEDEEVNPYKIRLRHLITEEYKITLYEGLKNYGDIFDRKNDPNELHNLWHENKELRYDLINELFHENLKAQSRYPHRQSLT